MPFTGSAPSNKRKATKIITDLSKVSQNDDESDPEASELDLGTKIKTPKDVMLEELSLLNNKGSKMFKMRQQRVEKFIVTNENNVGASRLQEAVLFHQQNLQNLLMSPPPPPPIPPKPEAPKEAGIGPLGQHLSVNPSDLYSYIRTYVSPWERAMKGDEDLVATMRSSMPGPIRIHPEPPMYKSFNRTALPYGGYDKASKLLTFELPEVPPAPEEPEPLPSLQADIRSRPSFNRTPIGWVCSEDSSHIHMDLDNIAFDGETDDL
uniref:Myozenin 1b n=1 Tax=Tetraodon nigroviridis TaxID=99883 RepID=H3CLN2_TETNG